MKYLLITAGCAECWGPGLGPLIEARGPFSTREEAAAASWAASQGHEWVEHPQGGWFISTGQGDDWILPVPDGVTLTIPKVPL